MLKDDDNVDLIINENKKISLADLEYMIQNGITPPDIKEIDDMPKEEWTSDDKITDNIEIETKMNFKRNLKPWEKDENKNINTFSNL